jgi:aminopeptidase N
MSRALIAVAASFALLGCSSDDAETAPPPVSEEQPTFGVVDVASMQLDVSLATLEATAVLSLSGPTDTFSFEAAGLTITNVEGAASSTVENGMLVVEDELGFQSVTVSYAFTEQSDNDGWLAGGTTLLWPYHCGNLFPCVSTPDDGLTFELSVRDVPAGSTAIFPASVTVDTPSYVPAWAVGAYSEINLGATTAGTAISVWHLPGGDQSARDGTADLTAVMDYFEQRLGPYRFGNKAGSVEANWGTGAFGGMEHHPFWHVGSGSMDDASTHAHEAAHGWYGDGVRIACWEDFVLSEGTVSYLTARVTEDVVGSTAAMDVWDSYDRRLTAAMASSALKIAWPQGCGDIDILDDGLFSSIPYMKGAMFFRALEQRIGVDALMDVLATFYQERVGTAASMQDLLDQIATDTGYDPTACAEAWLRQEAVPDMPICP